MPKSMRQFLIERDHGCVFCHMGYRKEEHIPIPYYDVHMFKGKHYSCCEYHGRFITSYWPTLIPKRKEMELLLDEYLKDKEDPTAL